MKLTKRQREVLKILHDQDTNIIHSYGETWVGDDRTNMKLVHRLLGLGLIQIDDFSNFNETEVYIINSDGIKAIDLKEILRDPNNDYNLITPTINKH